jgi:hypothetical protein
MTPARFVMLPAPTDARLILSGCDFAYATISLSEENGALPRAISRLGW